MQSFKQNAEIVHSSFTAIEFSILTSWPEECACAEPAVCTLGVECSCEETELEPSGEAVLPIGFWFQGFMKEGCLLEAEPEQ